MVDGFFIKKGFTSKADLLANGDNIKNFPVQSDQNGRQWLRPGNQADIISPANLIDSLNGNRRAYGGLRFTWNLRGLSPMMTKYIQDTLFDSGYSNNFTVQTFNRGSGSYETYQVIGRFPNLSSDATPALGGYDELLITFVNAVDAPEGADLEETTETGNLFAGTINGGFALDVTNGGDFVSTNDATVVISLESGLNFSSATDFDESNPLVSGVEYSTDNGSTYTGSVSPAVLEDSVTDVRITITSSFQTNDSVNVTLQLIVPDGEFASDPDGEKIITVDLDNISSASADSSGNVSQVDYTYTLIVIDLQGDTDLASERVTAEGGGMYSNETATVTVEAINNGTDVTTQTTDYELTIPDDALISNVTTLNGTSVEYSTDNGSTFSGTAPGDLGTVTDLKIIVPSGLGSGTTNILSFDLEIGIIGTYNFNGDITDSFGDYDTSNDTFTLSVLVEGRGEDLTPNESFASQRVTDGNPDSMYSDETATLTAGVDNIGTDATTVDSTVQVTFPTELDLSAVTLLNSSTIEYSTDGGSTFSGTQPSPLSDTTDVLLTNTTSFSGVLNMADLDIVANSSGATYDIVLESGNTEDYDPSNDTQTLSIFVDSNPTP